MPEPMTAHARLQSEMDGIQAWVEAMPLMDGDDHMVMQPTDILLLGIPERTIPMPNQVRAAAFQHRNADVDAENCFYDYNVLGEGPNVSHTSSRVGPFRGLAYGLAIVGAFLFIAFELVHLFWGAK